MGHPLRRISLKIATITPGTRWAFVEVERADSRVGTGEATLGGREEGLARSASRIVPMLLGAGADGAAAGMAPADPSWFARAMAPESLEDAAIVSALDMALWDLHGQDRDSPLGDLLGDALGRARGTLPLYANINRRTRDRSPAGFAQSARDALEAGFTALKIAPFDEVTPARCARGEGDEAMQQGVVRIAAVREAAGPGRRLMVDCHWRFDETAATRMIDAVAPYAPHWVECPIAETPASIDALLRLRRRAASHGVRLAGLEQAVGYEGFRAYCEAGCYDVMMPDVKYVGGMHQMLECARRFAHHGIAMSPHNPSGPVAHAASLQVSAAMASFDMLELQFDESPLFETLVGGGLAGCAGAVSPLPSPPGLGVGLDPAVLDACLERAPRVWEA